MSRTQTIAEGFASALPIPAIMRAAVYRGKGRVAVEDVPVPSVGDGEVLIRVAACGICGTDIKKIEHGFVAAPQIFGHEVAGTVVAVGPGVTQWKLGDRVMSFHHVPCQSCFYCDRRLYSQCHGYKKTGLTAGFDPNGGGFAQYTKAMPWVAQHGMVAIPDDISFEQATFIEPVNTCIKAVEKARVAAGEIAVVMGQGPIGLLLTMISKLAGAFVIGSDPMAERRAKSLSLGADLAIDPRAGKLADEIRARTAGPGRGCGAGCGALPGGAGRCTGAGKAGRSRATVRAERSEVAHRISSRGRGHRGKRNPGQLQRGGRPAAGIGAADLFTPVAGAGTDFASLLVGRHGRRFAIGGASGGRFSESGDPALSNNEQFAPLNGHMTAAVLYGSENLKIESVDIPKLAPDEALIRVKVALTCGTDLKVWKRGYHARMIIPPAVFGHELSGVIEQLGSEVNGGLKIGSRVVPSNSAPCTVCLFCRKGQSNLCEDLLFNNGAYAEYIRIPGRIVRQNMLVIPEHVSFQDAAMVEPLACVLRGIHETGIQPGDTTVVIGCGPIGLKFVRVLANRGVKVIALAKRANQVRC